MVGEWIKVGDHWPENDSFVLAFFGTNMSTVRYYENKFLAWDAYEEDFSMVCIPTYWMPLPTPPDSADFK